MGSADSCLFHMRLHRMHLEILHQLSLRAKSFEQLDNEISEWSEPKRSELGLSQKMVEVSSRKILAGRQMTHFRSTDVKGDRKKAGAATAASSRVGIQLS